MHPQASSDNPYLNGIVQNTPSANTTNSFGLNSGGSQLKQSAGSTSNIRMNVAASGAVSPKYSNSSLFRSAINASNGASPIRKRMAIRVGMSAMAAEFDTNNDDFSEDDK